MQAACAHVLYISVQTGQTYYADFTDHAHKHMRFLLTSLSFVLPDTECLLEPC